MKKEKIYNLKVPENEIKLAREYCENNFISLPNEVRKTINYYAKKQLELNKEMKNENS